MSTIKDVAKLAGVSASTVSRTLSNRIFVEEETRQKVMAAVKELNYQPNIIAKGLREGKTDTLALLVPDINSLFYPEVMRGIERVAAESGYSLLLCNTYDDIEREKKTLNMLVARGVDGIFCMSAEDDVEHLAALHRERSLPTVLVNRNAIDHVSAVAIDGEYGGYLVTKFLLDHGHRKIAGMFGNFSMQRFRDRYNGCKRAMEEYGIQDYKRFFIYNVDTTEEAYHRTQEMMAGEEKPTAFFASMDVLAIGIYSGLNEAGYRIPEDVSVIGFDNIFMTQYMLPPLTTYAVPIDQIAQKSMELLRSQMENKEFHQEVVLRGDLIERKSVREIERDT